MSLLKNNDPHYWLAEVVATPPQTVYSLSDFKQIVTAVITMDQVALSAGIDALSHAGVALFSQSDVDAALNPLIAVGDAFNQKYTVILQDAKQSGAAQVTAPDLRDDCIEMLTFVASALDQLTALAASTTTWGDWLAGLAGDWASSSQAILGGLTSNVGAFVASLTAGTQILFWVAVVGGASLVVYGGYRLVRRETGEKPQLLRRAA